MILQIVTVFAAAATVVYGDCVATDTIVGGSAAPTTVCSGDLIFSEEFDTLNTDVWKHSKTLAGGGNWEFQWYDNDPRNSYVRDSILYIYPTLLADDIGEDALYSATITIPADECTDSFDYGCERTGTATNILNPVKSAKITTTGTFFFRYGRVEARVKIPSGDWLWPAVWLMPEDSVYGGWPQSGEIDLLESRGNTDLISGDTNIGTHQVLSTLHWGTSSEDKYYLTAWSQESDVGYNEDFHTYSVTWTPNGISFAVDGVEIGSVYPETTFYEMGGFGGEDIWGGSKLGPLNQPFYLIINLAVGGTNGYFPDGIYNGHGDKPWSNTSPTAYTEFWQGHESWYPTWNGENAALQVDYIRVYAL